MSIERHEGHFIPTCDYCGVELQPEYTKQDSITAMKVAKWHFVKYANGWYNYCHECWTETVREELAQ